MVFHFSLVSMSLSVVYKVAIYADLMSLTCKTILLNVFSVQSKYADLLQMKTKDTAPESQEIPYAFPHTVQLGHIQLFIVLVVVSLCLLPQSLILLFSPVLY